MRRLKVVLAMVAVLAIILVSCKNKEDNKTNEAVAQDSGKHNPEDRKGPPHNGDKKGPPRGGSPEQTKTLEEIGGYKIGEIATDFNLKNVDGSMVSLASIKDAKGYIVTFTCNECPFSKLYEDRLIALHNTYAPQGYSVIAINPNSPENEEEGYEAMQVRAKEKGFTFPYLFDGEQKIYPQYGAVRTPHVFVLDKDRKVQYIGTIDDNAKSPEDVKTKYVEDAIKALQAGKTPATTFTKAIGCPVKAGKA